MFLLSNEVVLKKRFSGCITFKAKIIIRGRSISFVNIDLKNTRKQTVRKADVRNQVEVEQN